MKILLHGFQQEDEPRRDHVQRYLHLQADKCQNTSTRLQSITYQKTIIFMKILPHGFQQDDEPRRDYVLLILHCFSTLVIRSSHSLEL
jgi:hypothetical protein